MASTRRRSRLSEDKIFEQQKVVALLHKGLSYNEIADKLGITYGSVRYLVDSLDSEAKRTALSLRNKMQRLNGNRNVAPFVSDDTEDSDMETLSPQDVKRFKGEPGRKYSGELPLNSLSSPVESSIPATSTAQLTLEEALTKLIDDKKQLIKSLQNEIRRVENLLQEITDTIPQEDDI